MTRIWWQECKNQHAQFSECENQSRTVAQNLWISLAYRLIVFAFYIFLPFWNLSHIPAATNPRSSMLEILVDSLSRWLKRFEDSWFGTLDSASNATFQLDPAMLWASSKALSEGSRTNCTNTSDCTSSPKKRVHPRLATLKLTAVVPIAIYKLRERPKSMALWSRVFRRTSARWWLLNYLR